ncbi:MAG: hypothetical protein OIF40_00165 [Mangrovicoccus sp.]|nr:hypothetical protein [Mangrovicoccus sp.]
MTCETSRDAHCESLLTQAELGRYVMACEPVMGTALPGGGRRHYAPGARFAVRGAVAGSLNCADDSQRLVSFGADALDGLELVPVPLGA